MKSARRNTWIAVAMAVAVAVPTLSQLPLKNHSFSVDIPNAIVCRDGAQFDGQPTAASSLNLDMTPQIFDELGSTLIAQGTPHQFTTVGETRTFVVMYPLGTFAIGDPVGIAVSEVVGDPFSAEGYFNNARTVADCLVSGVPATPAWALALLLLLLTAGGVLMLKVASAGFREGPS